MKAGQRIDQTLTGGLRTIGRYKQSAPDKPLISVVTVVYNGEKHLEQTIRSVLNQSYDNIEYIIVDGGSADGTLNIIERYEDKIDYWVSQPDKGIYDAMNKGIEQAHGELIALLNADDYYEPDALKSVAEVYSLRKCPGIYYGHTYILQENLNIRFASYSNLKFWRGMSVGHQAMFVHRDIYKSIGEYNVLFKFAGDYDFFLRTLTQGTSYINIDKFLVNYRNSGFTIKHIYRSLNEGRIINKFYFGVLSKFHITFLLLLIRSIVLNELQNLVRLFFGKKVADNLSRYYLKKFIAPDQERIQ